MEKRDILSKTKTRIGKRKRIGSEDVREQFYILFQQAKENKQKIDQVKLDKPSKSLKKERTLFQHKYTYLVSQSDSFKNKIHALLGGNSRNIVSQLPLVDQVDLAAFMPQYNFFETALLPEHQEICRAYPQFKICYLQLLFTEDMTTISFELQQKFTSLVTNDTKDASKYNDFFNALPDIMKTKFQTLAAVCSVQFPQSPAIRATDIYTSTSKKSAWKISGSSPQQ